jgi:transcriptional regulator GlxA family with amidase domain
MFAAGGISTLDLILECVKKIKGKDYSDEIAHALIYRPREKSTKQKSEQYNLQWIIYVKNQF